MTSVGSNEGVYDPAAIQRWREGGGGSTIQPDPATANHLAVMVRGPVVVWFGRFQPSSDGVRVLQAFHHLVTDHRPDAYLIMAGPVDDPRHLEVLQAYVVELVLDRCWLLANPTPGQRAAFAERAVVHLEPRVVQAADRAAGRRLAAAELGDALAELLPAPALA